MTMAFRDVASALVTLLGTDGATSFRTVGYQQQSVDAEELDGSDRLVQVFYAGGSFPKTGGAVTGSRSHHARYRLELMTSSRVGMDVTRLDADGSTVIDRAQVLAAAATAEAAKRANDSWDDLLDDIYQILANPEHRDLDLKFPIGSLWIDRTEKDAPAITGERVVVTGLVELTCELQETATGATPVEAKGGVDVTRLIIYNQDETIDNSKAGVLVD